MVGSQEQQRYRSKGFFVVQTSPQIEPAVLVVDMYMLCRSCSCLRFWDRRSYEISICLEPVPSFLAQQRLRAIL
jgi:hypothetical protein